MPCGRNGIRRNRIDFDRYPEVRRKCLLVPKLCRTNKSEISGIKEKYRPFYLNILTFTSMTSPFLKAVAEKSIIFLLISASNLLICRGK